MKVRLRILVALVFGFAALAQPLVSSAQGNAPQNHKAKHHHYKLVDMGTLGGPNSSVGFAGYVAKSLNPGGTAVGEADTSTADPSCLVDCFVNHAFQWRNGVLADLGSLPGGNSSYAFWVNSRGWVTGLSENGVIDPLTGFPETAAVLWKDGEIIDLGTLGGSSSSANAVNNRGQVAGGALNTISDPFSATFFNTFIFETFGFYLFPVATQSHAFLWQDGTMQDLGTLGGPDSIAWLVNERGQVAGQSTINSIPSPTTGVPPVDPFFWDDGKMVDLGNFGGTFSFVAGLNNRGQVTGTMNLPGDLTYHSFLWDRGTLTDMGSFGVDASEANAINEAGEVTGWAANQVGVFGFLWKDGVLTNLGTVDGDPCSAAHSLNAKAQVVGESSPSCFDKSLPKTHAFLWENGGPMVDLNTLVPPGTELEWAGGVSINDRGEIDGDRRLPNGDIHAFLLIPCDEIHPNVEGCDYEPVETVNAVPLSAAESLQTSAASPAGLSPAEMMNRLRSSRAGRDHRHKFGPMPPK